jgi:hypothetical protein
VRGVGPGAAPGSTRSKVSSRAAASENPRATRAPPGRRAARPPRAARATAAAASRACAHAATPTGPRLECQFRYSDARETTDSSYGRGSTVQGRHVKRSWASPAERSILDTVRSRSLSASARRSQSTLALEPGPGNGGDAPLIRPHRRFDPQHPLALGVGPTGERKEENRTQQVRRASRIPPAVDGGV